MVKQNKSYVPTAIKLRTDLALRLDDYKSRTGVSKTFVIEKALEDYLDRMSPESG